MKRIITIIGICSILGACSDSDVTESNAKLSEKLNNNDIYSVNPYDHIVFSDTSVYYYRTGRFGDVRYFYKIKPKNE